MIKDLGHNHEAYNSKKIINEYAHSEGLTPPEKSIYEIVKSSISRDNMLDIGIGTGRTSEPFSKIFKNYIGVDYSSNMVEHCKNHLKIENASFLTIDARDLTQFADNSFDFVLFSFNGIDSVCFADRDLILSEIKRVLKDKGQFCFSAHNLYCLPKFKKFHFRKNPIGLAQEFYRWVRMNRTVNKIGDLSKLEYVHVKDGAHNFKMNLVYIKPEVQIAQLLNYGFSQTRSFSCDTGKELINDSEFSTNPEGWVYFLSEVNK